MAWYTRRSKGSRPYYKRRARFNRSVKAINTSRAFKASAANMTQNGKFNVSTKFIRTIDIEAGSQYGMVDCDIPNEIVLADMHKALSNVFDQYRVEKCTLKFNLLLNSTFTSGTPHISFFTAVDRTGFAANATVPSIRTYGSYKETTWSLTGDSNAPHVISLGQADMVSRSEFYDTKNRAKFPQLKIGFDVAEVQLTAKAFTITCEIDAQIRYRGVRLDTTGVLARVNIFQTSLKITNAFYWDGEDSTAIDNWNVAREETSTSLNPGYSACIIRRWDLTIGDETEHGWRIWTVTVPTNASSKTITVSASEEAPAYACTWSDGHLNFDKALMFTTEGDYPLLVNGGCGGSSNTSSHEDWKFFPDSVYDFKPLIKAIEDNIIEP